MRFYETTYIANQELTKKQIDLLTDSLEEIIKSCKGKIAKKEYWGIRNFSYPIKKQKRGHYIMLSLESPVEGIQELEKKLGTKEEVLKYLTINVDKISDEVSQLAKDENSEQQ